jgi:hypothetical protein
MGAGGNWPRLFTSVSASGQHTPQRQRSDAFQPRWIGIWTHMPRLARCVLYIRGEHAVRRDEQARPPDRS